jgi:uncharacterized protein YdeI (YjbR/CyaY-like superfamily)
VTWSGNRARVAAPTANDRSSIARESANTTNLERRMSPLDVSRSVPMATDAEFHRWLKAHGKNEREVVVAIYKKASGKQSVAFTTLLDTALCHGWIDTQTKSIDDERYAIRFVPRRPGSNWSPTNRQAARRLLEEGRMTARGIATLPSDL